MSVSRRQILGTIALLPLASIAVAEPLPKKFGRVAAGVRGRKLRVTVDGMDVTNVGVDASDVEGWVKCLLWEGYPNPPGNKPKLVIDRRAFSKNVMVAESGKNPDGTATVFFVYKDPFYSGVRHITLRGHVVIEERT